MGHSDQSPADGRPSSSQRRAIVVEPSSVMRTVFTKILEQHDLEAVVCSDALEALAEVVQSEPAVIITSHELRGLRGGSIPSALKCDPRYRAIPICLTTSAESIEEELGHYRPDVILSKECDLDTRLAEYLESLGLGVADGSSEECPDDLEWSVLLVEDGGVNRMLYSRWLHVSGAQVTVAENGAEALRIAGRTDFDAILMDIEMPEMDGFESTKALRVLGVTTPILALTSMEGPEFQAKALAGGFSAVLPKTVSHGRLVTACRAHIARHRSKRAG